LFDNLGNCFTVAQLNSAFSVLTITQKEAEKEKCSPKSRSFDTFAFEWLIEAVQKLQYRVSFKCHFCLPTVNRSHRTDAISPSSFTFIAFLSFSLSLCLSLEMDYFAPSFGSLEPQTSAVNGKLVVLTISYHITLGTFLSVLHNPFSRLILENAMFTDLAQIPMSFCPPKSDLQVP
jgi:hypothetical protein